MPDSLPVGTLSVGARARDLKPVTDQGLSVPGPPADLQWPPEGDGGTPGGRGVPRWTKWLGVALVVFVIAAIAGAVIRIPYDTFSPGGALNLETRVSVKGAKTYPGRGELSLLFVRERTNINLWTWLAGTLDSNTDIVKQDAVTGGTSQRYADLQAVCDMTQSQVHARVAALKTLGYRVPTLPGLTVADLPQYDGKVPLPAYNVLEPCDEIVAADGHVIGRNTDLSKIVEAHRPGTSVTLRINRGGKLETLKVPVVAVPGGRRIIGVDLEPRYNVPVPIDINTSDISGPSAGLAMTLAIIDQLTPGNLTGGKNVAVTGTIDPNGNVGEIGALEQKAVAARAAGAKLFIVPACANDPGKAACLEDIAKATKRVGKDVKVAPVSTLAQALDVLRAAGGQGVPTPAST